MLVAKAINHNSHYEQFSASYKEAPKETPHSYLDIQFRAIHILQGNTHAIVSMKTVSYRL